MSVEQFGEIPLRAESLLDSRKPAPIETQQGIEWEITVDEQGHEYARRIETEDGKQYRFSALLLRAGLGKYASTRLSSLAPFKFVADKSNFALLHRLKHGKSMFMVGPSGTGKTTLAIALAREMLWDNKRVMVVRWQNLINQIRNGFGQEKRSDLVERASNADLLVIDELGNDRKQKSSEFESDTLFDIVTARYGNDRQTIVTTNLDPEHLDGLYGRAVMDRLMDCQTVIYLNFSQEKMYRSDRAIQRAMENRL